MGILVLYYKQQNQRTVLISPKAVSSMMKSPLSSACLMAALLFPSQSLFAHARFSANKLLKPRDNRDNLKTGPCGNVAQLPLDQRTQIIAGSKITVEWEETTEHPGWYRLAFSPDGSTGFDDNVLLDNILDTTGSISYGNPSTWHRYSAEIEVPTTPCENCTIQLIQVMTENPAMPRNYYSCADVRIIAADNTAEKPATPIIKKITVTKSVVEVKQ